MGKYYGNQKYIDQLMEFYGAQNAATKAHRAYKNLTPVEKSALVVIVSPVPCCVQSIVWNTWDLTDWNSEEHVWGSDIEALKV